jgi:uncharacterized protein (TIGR02646 family)
MKQIVKTTEPNSLLQHRASQFANFDNIPLATKEELRQSLLSEQGHICCYCMKRIPEHTSPYMKVEHYKCQSKPENSHLILDYKNLLGACTGNENKPTNLRTCDTKKGNAELTISPTATLPSCETLFKYNSEGEISSTTDNADLNRQLNEVLNLNMQTLKDGRREIYLEVQERVRLESKRTKKDKASFVKFLEQERVKWLELTDNKHRPYCSVAVYYLTKKIKSNQN